MNLSKEDIQALVDAQQPIHLGQRPSLFVLVITACLTLSLVAVGLRIYCRLWKKRSMNIWGWDDVTAIPALLAYIILFAITVVAIRFGLGAHDGAGGLGLAAHVRAVRYTEWANVTYFVAIAFTKASIGIAVLRLAQRRPIRWFVAAMIVISNATYAGGFVLDLVTCKFIWDRRILSGCNRHPSFPVVVMTMSTLTDFAYAIIPAMLLHGLQMPARPKYALIGVFAMGSIAPFVCAVRFPIFLFYWNRLTPGKGSLVMAVWVPVLSLIEVTIGLIAGSLPSLGSLFHFFDASQKPTCSLAERPQASGLAGGSAPRNLASFQRDGSLRLATKGVHWTNITAESGAFSSISENSPQGILVTEDISCSVSRKDSKRTISEEYDETTVHQHTDPGEGTK